MLSGGQFSRRIPRERPRDARTSLISVSDFLPRFGVLSSSTSVRCTRSPMYWIASAFKQFAERTVSSRSSTGRSRIAYVELVDRPVVEAEEEAVEATEE